ncbi:MAG: ATP-binding protein [Pseudomonadota bacterium]
MSLSEPPRSGCAPRFDERLGMLVQREIDWRDGERAARLLNAAGFRDRDACIEDIDRRTRRGLHRGRVSELASCDWLRRGDNVLITGAAVVRSTRRVRILLAFHYPLRTVFLRAAQALPPGTSRSAVPAR